LTGRTDFRRLCTKFCRMIATLFTHRRFAGNFVFTHTGIVNEMFVPNTNWWLTFGKLPVLFVESVAALYQQTLY